MTILYYKVVLFMFITNNYYPQNIPSNASIRVRNLESRRSGEAVRNQFCVSIPLAGIKKFQSYKTLCLSYDIDCKVITVYPCAFGYSTTTSKYSRQFLEDECHLSSDAVSELSKLVKAHSGEIGEDCPLYVQL